MKDVEKWDSGDEFFLALDLDRHHAVLNSSGAEARRPCERVGGSPALVMGVGDTFSTPPILLGGEHVLRVAGSSVSADRRARISVRIQVDGLPAVLELATWSCGNDQGSTRPHGRTMSIPLDEFAGREAVVSLHVLDAEAHVAECILGASHRLPILHALSSYEFRLAEEVSNFSGAAYTHALYGSMDAEAPDAAVREIQDATDLSPAPPEEWTCDALRNQAHEALTELPVAAGEMAYSYGMRALSTLLPMSPPDFGRRAESKSLEGPLRVLSLCSGAARIEQQLFASCEGPVQITLLDASSDLAARAASRLASLGSHLRAEVLVGDINKGIPGSDSYDIVMCVSALHHVVELERVMSQAAARLRSQGEFWSIGEQIGRNGNRLWPRTRVAANRAFALLPDALRTNSATGRIDPALDDADYSEGCFEGIRSEEVEDLLEAYFCPVHVYKRNAFLWRIIDPRYSDAYDLGNPEHVDLLRWMVAHEFAHWATGGRSTELHGVYRKKEIQSRCSGRQSQV